jgi:hypothetical protein
MNYRSGLRSSLEAAKGPPVEERIEPGSEGFVRWVTSGCA